MLYSRTAIHLTSHPSTITLALAAAALTTAIAALTLGLLAEPAVVTCRASAVDTLVEQLGLAAAAAAGLAVLAEAAVAVVRRAQWTLGDCVLVLGMSLAAAIDGLTAAGASLNLCVSF